MIWDNFMLLSQALKLLFHGTSLEDFKNVENAVEAMDS